MFSLDPNFLHPFLMGYFEISACLHKINRIFIKNDRNKKPLKNISFQLENLLCMSILIGRKKTPRTFVRGVFSFILVGPAGVEPTTNGLKVRCSTN